jgi:c-di-GMP-binding flagellar brake protein YcgR
VLFSKPLHANVEVVDSQKLTLTISQLSYVTGTMGKRLRVRVQPKTLLRAKLLMDEGDQLEASIADISAEGMGLILMGANTSPEEMIRPHDQIQVQFHLSGSGDLSGGHILVSASVVYVKALDGSQRKRVGLQLYPGESASRTIRKYIFDRQVEIHNALGKRDWGLEDHSS